MIKFLLSFFYKSLHTSQYVNASCNYSKENLLCENAGLNRICSTVSSMYSMSNGHAL